MNNFQLVPNLLTAVFFNRGSTEPKGSVSARQGFRRWPVRKQKGWKTLPYRANLHKPT